MNQKLEYFFKDNSWQNSLQSDIKLSSYTSFKCKGNADYLIKVATKNELKKIIRFCYQNKINYLFLGKGSNLIFTEQGFNGLLILLDGDFKKIEKDQNYLRVGGGISSTGLASYLKNNNLGGGEFLIGIPATVGGLVFMNAGANGMECQQIIFEVLSIDSRGNEIKRKKPEINFGYRHSIFMNLVAPDQEVIIEACFQFTHSNSGDIKKKQNEILSKRKATQPINKLTWGSVFKNPKAGFAAEMIEKSGFKGKKFGDLRVSPKHSNFFENMGNANYQDIVNGLTQIQDAVNKKFNCFLVPEVRIIDEQGKLINKFYTP